MLEIEKTEWRGMTRVEQEGGQGVDLGVVIEKSGPFGVGP